MKFLKYKSIISLLLCCVMLISGICISMQNSHKSDEVLVRTVTISDTIDTEKILSEFEDASWTENEKTITFYGKKTFNTASLSEIDEISFEEDFEENFEYYMTEYFEENPPTVTYLLNVNKEEYTFDLTLTLAVDEEVVEDTVFGFLVENEDGQLDGLVCLEEECVLLSEICDANGIDNVGLFSNIWKRLKTAATNIANKIKKIFTQPLKVVVQLIIVPIVKVVGFALEFVVISVSSARSNQNYNHNKNQSLSEVIDSDGYIFVQNIDEFENWKFGLGTVRDNGCGVIATYNALRFVGQITNDASQVEDNDINKYHRETLANIIAICERNAGALVMGLMGINPGAIAPVLSIYGVNVATYSRFVWGNLGFEYACDNLREDQMAILCYWWTKDNGEVGAHYVAFTKVNGDYVVYNGESLNDGLKNGTIGNFLYDDPTNNGFIQGWVVTR